MQLDPGISVNSHDTTAARCRRADAASLAFGFIPAFRHLETGEVRLCQLADGRVSTDHLLDSLPNHWVLERDAKGRPMILVSAIEPGFIRGIQFWSLEDMVHPALDG